MDLMDSTGGSMSAAAMLAAGMDVGNGVCSVCGDKSAGRHYGVMACYGCKGFFRRTIRSKQSYNCRFQQRCSIDKDQRNACRFCRFQRCLQVGMEITAIRPDRDVIGKQKNPRKRKLLLQQQCSKDEGGPVTGRSAKGELGEEGSCLPSPGTESNSSQQEDLLLNFLMDIDAKAGGGGVFSSSAAVGHRSFDAQQPEPMELAIGIMPGAMGRPMMVKPDPDISLFLLLQNPQLMIDCREPVSHAQLGQLASTQQLGEAMRKYVLMCVDWVNALFAMANLDSAQEKLALLKNAFAAFCTFEQATSTAKMCVAGLLAHQQAICLCNGTLVPRDASQQVSDTSLLANNIVGRVLDELVAPLRRLQLSEQERVALAALILLDGDTRSSLGDTDASGDCCGLYLIKDKLQNALFQHVRERCEQSLNRASSRFANILLLLPAVAKVSSIYYENVQLAKMFGRQSLDPLLAEIFDSAATSATMTNSCTTNSAGSPAPISASSSASLQHHASFGSPQVDFEPLFLLESSKRRQHHQMEEEAKMRRRSGERRLSSTEMDQLLLAPLFVQPQQQKSTELSSPEVTEGAQQQQQRPEDSPFVAPVVQQQSQQQQYAPSGAEPNSTTTVLAHGQAWPQHQPQPHLHHALSEANMHAQQRIVAAAGAEQQQQQQQVSASAAAYYAAQQPQQAFFFAESAAMAQQQRAPNTAPVCTQFSTFKY